MACVTDYADFRPGNKQLEPYGKAVYLDSIDDPASAQWFVNSPDQKATLEALQREFARPQFQALVRSYAGQVLREAAQAASGQPDPVQAILDVAESLDPGQAHSKRSNLSWKRGYDDPLKQAAYDLGREWARSPEGRDAPLDEQALWRRLRGTDETANPTAAELRALHTPYVQATIDPV